MLDRMETLIRYVSIVLASCSAAAILVIPIMIGYSTLARYLVGNPVIFTEELAGFLLVACVFLAIPYAAIEGKHVKFSLVLDKLSPRLQLHCQLITNLAAFVFMCIVTKLTFDFTLTGYLLNSHSETARIYEVPWRAVMPICSAWLAFVLLFSAVRDVISLTSGYGNR